MLAIACTAPTVSAQYVNSNTAPEGYGLSVDTVSADIGMLVGLTGTVDLTGYACYRLYVELINENDFLSSISGDELNPTYVTTTTTYYHALIGGLTASSSNPMLFPVYPDLQFDSYVTIGLEGPANATAGESNISTVQSTGNPWATVFDAGAGLPGGNISIDDPVGGAWYALNGDANGIPGPALRVLVGQFTTDGELSGQLFSQVFINGLGETEFRDTFFFGPAVADPGCTDPTACNYATDAEEDDGSCEYPIDLWGSAALDCEGNCLEDSDTDGVCDSDEVPGCTDEAACNYAAAATDDDGSCAALDALDICGGTCAEDFDGDGICDDSDPCVGPASNVTVMPIIPATLIAEVSFNGASAFYATVYAYVGGELRGMAETVAYDGAAYVNLSIYAETGDEVNFTVFQESTCEACTSGDNLTVWSLGEELGSFENPGQINAVCAGVSLGCMDSAACNYDASALIDDASCTFADEGFDCDGNCLADLDGDGICDGDDPCIDPDLTAEVLPLIPAAFIATVSFDGANSSDFWVIARVNGQTRGAAEPFMFEDAAYVNMTVYAAPGDAIEFSIFQPTTCTECLVLWGAEIATEGESYGSYDDPVAFDAVCNPVWGCLDELACNFNEEANLDSDDCIYPGSGYDCDGTCLEDADGDGICDMDEVPGCTESGACNYMAEATDNDGGCDFDSCAGCIDALACNFDDSATIDDGTCEFSTCAGCMDTLACNFDDSATIDDGVCEFAEAGLDCAGNCLEDGDGDGICDGDEIPGCTDTVACNYDSEATDEDGSCEYGTCSGCMDALACNYNAGATIGDDSCEYADAGLDCEGNCLVDADEDGICDEDEVGGCTDALACNFDADATDDDSSCEYTSCAGCMDALACNYDGAATIDNGDCTFAEAGYDCDGNCLEDADEDGVCDGDEIDGCMDTTACNYNAEATDESGDCTFADPGYDCDGNLLGLDPCDPDCIMISPSIDDYTLECLEDFDGLGCDDITVTNNCTSDTLEVGCYTAPNLDGYSTGLATTAYGNGPDAVIRIYGLSQQGFADSDYFLEAGEGLSFTQYDNGTAVLEGEIVNELNTEQRWEVFYVFEDGVDGGTWADMGRGYKHIYGCDSLPFEDWDIYILQGDQSYLQGLGDYEGSLLHIGHAPTSHYFGFQVGQGGNDHNCNMGLGGWFNWSGQIDGTEVMGSMGDVIADVTIDDVPNEGPEACVTNVYTVFDDSCGVYTFEQQVCRLDTTAPFFTICPGDTVLACGEDLPLLGWVEAEDNCIDAGNPEVSYLGEFVVDQTASSCYTLERRWQAEDLFGNIGYCTQTLQVVDSIAPEVSIQIPGDVTLNVNALCSVFDDPEMTGYATFNASDNCVLAGTELVYVDVAIDSVSTGCYTIERTWTATTTDSCGNISIADGAQLLYVQDVIAPSIGISIVEAELACDQWVCDIDQLVEYGILTYADNCVIDTAYATCYGMSGGCVAPAPTFNVVYTVVDACGNTTLESQFITMIDTVLPEISFVCPPDTTVGLDANCEADWTEGALVPMQVSALDNCDVLPTLDYTVADSEPVWLCEQGEGSFVVERTWTATSVDHCGNEAVTSCTQVITVVDTVAPVVTDIFCPTDTVINMDASCAADLGLGALGDATALAVDGCDSDPGIAIFHSDGPSTFVCAVENDSLAQGSYSFTRTFYAYSTDDCGNIGDTISCEQFIEVNDVTAPVFLDAEPSVTVSCELLYDPTDPALVALEFYDACDSEVSVSISAAAVDTGSMGAPSCPGIWLRTWTVTDDCGNSSSFDQEVVLIDTTAPGMECPADIEIYLDLDPTDDTTTVALGEPILTDNCTLLEEIVLVHFDSEFVVACAGDDALPEGTLTFVRTFTATDDCGNFSVCEQIVNILDTVAPLASLTDSIVACEDYDAEVEYTVLSASDNTDSDVAYSWVEDSVYAVECVGSFKVDRTYTFVDDCGNFVAVQQTVTVVDLNAPYVVDGPTPYALACEAYTDAPEGPAYITVEDGCGGAVDLTWTDTPFSGGCVQPFGLVLRQYVLVDDCGNVGTFEQYLELFDDTDPVVSMVCPADTVLVVDAECMTDLSVDLLGWAQASATDNCGTDEPAIEVTFEDGLPIPGCIGEYEIVRTFTAVATDHCGNTDTTSCNMVISVFDQTGPVTALICPPDTTISLEADCTVDVSYDLLGTPTVSAMDACDPATGTSWWHEDGEQTMLCDGADGSDGNDEGSYSFTRTFYATSIDGCGNLGDTVSCEQLITALDVTAPLFEGEFNTFVACDVFNADSVYALTATDGCDSDVQIFITAAYPVSASCAGTWLREYDAVDDCGNWSHYTQIINVIDTVAPVITLSCPDNLDLFVDANCYADTSLAGAGEALVIFSDNCDEALETSFAYVDLVEAGDCSGEYAFTRTWTATAMDMCDNYTSVSCSQTVTVSDTLAPVWDILADAGMDAGALPGDSTVSCGFVPEAAILTATDGCDPVASVLFEELTDDYGAGCAGEYTLTRTWTASDDCGNELVHQQTLVVIDTVAPVFTTELPADTTVSCLSIPAPAAMEIFELCDAAIEIVFYQWATPGACGDEQIITRSWSAVDCAGNAIQHEQTLTVIDDTAPVIDGPLELTLSCELWSEDSLYAEAYDPCGGGADGLGGVTLVMGDVMPFSGSCVASYLVTYVATDDCGNESTMIQSITLIDTVAPVFDVVPADVTLQCGDDGSVDALGFAIASDACNGDVAISFEDEVIGVPGVYTLVRHWAAEDMCGNTVMADQTIQFVDTVAPFFMEALPGDLVAACDDIPAVAVLTAMDSCSGAGDGEAVAVVFSADTVDGDDCASDFTIIRTWTAEDFSGNAIVHVQTIEVVDDVAPQILSGPADAVVSCDDVPVPAGVESLSVTDNCDGDVQLEYLGETTEAGGCSAEMLLTRTWLALDCAGNSSEWSQLLTVVDVVAPELALNFAGLGAGAAVDTSVVCAADVPELVASAEDACDGEPVVTAWTDTLSADGCGNSVVAHYFMATDGCGNSTTQAITISVLDTIAPQWTATCDLADGDEANFCSADFNGEVPAFPGLCAVEAADACGGEVELAWTATPEGANVPNDSVLQYCATTTPEAFAGGMTCTGYDPHAMRMFNFPGAELYLSVGDGVISQMSDGAWTISQTVADIGNLEAGFDIEVRLVNGMDWDTWSDQPFDTDYKQDCEDLPDNHQAWMYWTLESGTLTGWGDYAGSEMTMSHQPANLFYGFQVGEAANNMNDAHGYSGWFFYDGTFDGAPITGSGDLFGQLDCALPYTVHYAHTATDCSGNEASLGYSIVVNGGDCEETEVAPADIAADFSTADASELAEDNAPLRMAALSPNPARSTTRLGFEVDHAMRVDVDLIGVDGRSAEAIYAGSAEPGLTYLLDIWVEDLPAGVYQVRVQGAGHQIVQKLVIQN